MVRTTGAERCSRRRCRRGRGSSRADRRPRPRDLRHAADERRRARSPCPPSSPPCACSACPATRRSLREGVEDDRIRLPAEAVHRRVARPQGARGARRGAGTAGPRGLKSATLAVAAPRTGGEMADAADLGSAAARRGGSSPFPCTSRQLRDGWARALTPDRVGGHGERFRGGLGHGDEAREGNEDGRRGAAHSEARSVGSRRGDRAAGCASASALSNTAMEFRGARLPSMYG